MPFGLIVTTPFKDLRSVKTPLPTVILSFIVIIYVAITVVFLLQRYDRQETFLPSTNKNNDGFDSLRGQLIQYFDYNQAGLFRFAFV